MVESMQDYAWKTGGEGVSQRLNLGPLLALSGTIGQGTRVLDLGCGTGVISRAFAARGCDVTGIDPGDKSREFFEAEAASNPARDRLRFIQAEGSRAAIRSYLDAGGEPFDLVISSQVIEHVYDPWDFTGACYDALRPGGRVVISTPYHGYLKNLLIGAIGRWDKHHTTLIVGMHIRFFSKPTLTQIMEDTGFESLVFKGFGRAPLLWQSMALAGNRPQSPSD